MNIAAVITTACLAGCIAGCGRSTPGPRESRPAVAERPQPAQRTAAVETRDFPIDEIVAPGKVELNPNRVSKVLPPTPGRVRRVLVRLGDAVQAGQPVVVLESADAGLALATYAQAEAQAHQAAIVLAKSEKDLARSREWNAAKAAPLKEVVAAEADVETARAGLAMAKTAAEESLHLLQLLGLDPARHTHEISVPAPISGKVLDLSVAPSEMRNDTNQPLMTIADLSTVWITSQVSENSIRLVTVGEPVDISFPAYPGEVFHGRVRRIADTFDADTRTVKVQAELDNRSGRFRPEMFARIRHSHGARKLICVPAAAVVHRAGDAWVMVQRGAGFGRTRVQVGDSANGCAPVFAGLSEGDHVVVDGAAMMRDR